jgi:hypothetical protein
MVSTKKPPRAGARPAERGAPQPRAPGLRPRQGARPSFVRRAAMDARGVPDLHATFAALRGVLAKHARHLLVVFDTPDEYTLNTRKPGQDGAPVLFGSTQLRGTHVTFELMPLQLDPVLAAALSPGLRRHLQGKRGFTFTHLEPALLEELDLVTGAGMASFNRRGLA